MRHLTHDEPDDAWLARHDVQRGLRELARRGLTFDLLLRPQHLRHVPPLADALYDRPARTIGTAATRSSRHV